MDDPPKKTGWRQLVIATLFFKPKFRWSEFIVALIISLVILWLALDVSEWWLGHPLFPKD